MGIAPNASCCKHVCALDERDDAVALPIDNAEAMLIDDEWAYFSQPAGFVRAGLRTGTVEVLIPNAAGLAAAEANGCIYVEAVFTAPGAHLVRIPR